MKVNFTEFQKRQLREVISNLIDIRIKNDFIEFYIENGEVLKTEKITRGRMEWIRLQKGTEPEFVQLMFDLLFPLAKNRIRK